MTESVRTEGKAGLRIAALFLTARLALIISLPIESLRGYGDLHHFYELAALGNPFLDLWVEFPPLFPFLSRGIYLLSAPLQHVYDYGLILLLTLAQTASVYIFVRLGQRLISGDRAEQRGWTYALLLVALPYGWWYFDPLAVLAMLAGLFLLLDGRGRRSALALGLGGLTKFFPLLILPGAWKWLPRRTAVQAVAISLGMLIAMIGLLWINNPEMTRSSLSSQASKGSWETVWALIDGNLQTGNLGPELERLDPQAAFQLRGEPAQIAPWATLIGFAALGLAIFLTVEVTDPFHVTAFSGVTWGLFLLWSPGWSPQWVLYLLPLILLTFRGSKTWMFSVNLIAVSLLEWPLLLSRGRFDLLWVPIVIRTALLVLLTAAFARELRYRMPAWVERRRLA